MSEDAKQRTLEMLRVIRMDILTRARAGDLDYERSIATLHKHLNIATGIKNMRLLAQTYNALAVVELGRGHLQAAETYLRQGISATDGHDLGHTTGVLYGNLGEIYRRQARYNEALEAFATSQVIFEPYIGEHNGWSTGENNRGWTYLALQNYAVARACFENVPRTLNVQKDPAIPTLIETYTGLAEVELAEGNIEQAWINAKRAEEVTLNQGNRRQLDLVYATQSHIAAQDGSQDAAALFAKCREALAQYSTPPAVARFILNEALYQQRHGNLSAAHKLATECHALFLELDMQQEADLAAQLMG